MIKLTSLQLTFLLVVTIATSSFAQNQDSIQVAGQIGITNNGISTVPNFSLNKPAITTEFNFIKGRFSFDPMILFSAEMKPWQTAYRVHYLLVDKPKFKLSPGAGIAYSYNIADVVESGEPKSIIKGNSYYNLELAANYTVNKYLSLSSFYMYGKGREQSGAGFLHYESLGANIQTPNFSGNYFINLSPQVYYLLLNQSHGFFYAVAASINNRKSPISLSGMVNAPLGSKNTMDGSFVWSLSLSYAFNKTFIYRK